MKLANDPELKAMLSPPGRCGSSKLQVPDGAEKLTAVNIEVDVQCDLEWLVCGSVLYLRVKRAGKFRAGIDSFRRGRG